VAWERIYTYYATHTSVTCSCNKLILEASDMLLCATEALLCGLHNVATHCGGVVLHLKLVEVLMSLTWFILVHFNELLIA